MTPEERNLLQQFLQDLRQTTGGAAKDTEAEQLISNAVGANPDAAYLLVQHALIADQALHAAQAQIEALQSQSAPSSPAPSFLGGAPAAPPGGPAQAPSGPFAANSGLGGFLRSAGTMAAGVAGGEFLAQGLSNIFSPGDW